MFPTHDMTPRAITAMLEERDRHLERALQTARPLALPTAGSLICMVPGFVATAFV